MFAHAMRGRYRGAVDQLRTWLPRGVALAAFVLYVLAAPPGPFWLDSGELAAASFQLGSAHPTGFPLFCLLGKAATLVPLGEIAFRINLLSAVCAGFAVLWIGRLVLEICDEDRAALAGAAAAGLTLAVSFTFFRQATVTEVYAPNAALLTLTLLLFARLVRGGESSTGLLLAVVVGLGGAIHITYLFAVPPIVVYLLMRLRRGARWPLIAPLLVVMTVVATYAYLPVRSGTERVATVDWGHPRTASGFVDHVSAGRPRRSFSKASPRRSASAMKSRTPAVVAFNIEVFYRAMTRDLGPLIWIAMLGGLFWLLRRGRTRWIGVTLVLLLFLDSVFSIWLNPMGQTDFQNGVPFALAATAVAGVGVAWFARSLGRAAPFGGGLAALMLVVPAAMGSFEPAFAASSGDLPRAWSEAGFVATPSRGVALVMSDSTAAGMIYLSTVEAARPDVAVIVRQHLRGDRERSRRMLERSGGSGAAAAAAEPLGAVLTSGRPVTWEIGRDAPPPGWGLDVGATLSAVRARTTARRDTADIRRSLTQISAMLGAPSSSDSTARLVLASAVTGLGRMAYGRADLTLASSLFDAALAIRPHDLAALVNRGVVAGKQGDNEAAVQFTERALAIDPNHVNARINAARWHLRAGRDASAERHLRRALRIDPRRASAWALGALIDLRTGNPARAQMRLRKARDLDPRNADYLDVVRQLMRRKSSAAPR